MPTQRTAIIASLVLSALASVLSAVTLLFATGIMGAGRPVSGNFDEQARVYLMENPEILIESVNRFQAEQHAVEEDAAKQVVRDRRDEIFNDPAAPVAGNPNGDVTIVEFFDYNCPYCRKAVPLLAGAQKSDSGLRLVYKEFPILGPGSHFAARAALAAAKQGKYEPFHKAMMAHKGAIEKGSTMQIAGQVGLDVERLKKDMEDPAIAQAIERNLVLATDLRINGTPGFVIGEEIARGLIELPTMREYIEKARETAKR